MEIKILPNNIANMIAAGEVVQRPASVVKELMENAVDAGASQISVVIQDAGRTLIQVIDNGSGMNPDDAVLCFERHATSKLQTSEDLMNILTFGFRGEALASVASVAQVTLKTRTKDMEVGCEVCFAASKNEYTQEVATPVGTNIAVRDLFYNIPARRKHLKSDAIEFKHIVSEITRIALVYPEKGFSVSHNGKDVLVLSPAKSLKYRIQSLLGANVVNELSSLEVETSVVKLGGYIGRPEGAKKALGNQFCFVNGRYFKSNYFHKAIMNAYENLIPSGYNPAYFLYFEVDPQSVDVNVHPTKTEIKFENDSMIFQIIYSAVKETLGKNSFISTIDFETEKVNVIPSISGSFLANSHIKEPTIGVDDSYNPFDNDGFASEMPFSTSTTAARMGNTEFSQAGALLFSDNDGFPKNTEFQPHHTSFAIHKRDDYGKLFDEPETTVPESKSLIIQGKYIITRVHSGLMMINVRRANEKILYARFLANLSRNEHITQSSLFPLSMELGVENTLLFEAHSELLKKLGFDIDLFGNDTIVVNGVPEGYPTESSKIQSMVSDLIFILADNPNSLEGEMLSCLADNFARLGAINAEGPKNQSEATMLIDKLFACEDSEFTKSGKRIINIMSIEDIEKRF